ncbi:MAG TPA: GNAT family N-acetyltransferase [Planctomycetaceae bacterium]|nr:GNAT family N-acetyltransferase [Planctomycetaceae bacterium]
MCSSIEVKELTAEDAELLDSVADDVFDDTIVRQRAGEFLGDPRHHLVAAVSDGWIVGFASAVHYVHPDKAWPEMWVNELGVAPHFRRQGIATELLNRLSEIAGRIGCRSIWVLTERSNAAAMALYGSLSRSGAEDAVLFTIPVQDADAAQ